MQKNKLEIGSRRKSGSGAEMGFGVLLFKLGNGLFVQHFWSHALFIQPYTDIVTRQPSIESELLELSWYGKMSIPIYGLVLGTVLQCTMKKFSLKARHYKCREGV